MFFQKVDEPSILISNAFFLVSTVVIVAAAQGHSVRVAKREFFGNLDLQETKTTLEHAFSDSKNWIGSRASSSATLRMSFGLR